MSGLLMPRGSVTRPEAAAETMQNTAIHRMTSDDFVTRREVQEQLDKLAQYLTDRRSLEGEEEYQLPQPSGWKIMVLMLTVSEKTDGGLFVVSDSLEAKAMSSPQGVVLGMGPAAYTDASRFSVHGSVEPWHKIGDRIMWVKYDAASYQLSNGQRLGFMVDTTPSGTLDTGWEVPR